MPAGYQHTIHPTLPLTLTCIIDDTLDLLLHTLQSIGPTSSPALTHTKTDASAIAKLQHALVVTVHAHTTANNRAVDLRVEVLRVWILSNELRDLDARDEILVRLRHEVVVPTLCSDI